MLRQATIKDIPALVTIAQTMHLEGSYAGVPFDPDFYAIFLEVCLEDANQALFVYEKNGSIVGALHAAIEPFIFNPAFLQAVEKGFYVDPAHRGAGAAVILERAFRLWAAEKKALRACLSHSNGHDKAGEFFAKLGYTYSGRIYVLNLREM